MGRVERVLTHREVAWSAWAWMMRQRWAHCGTIELACRQGVLDAVAVSHRDARTPRLAVVEVKVSRGDLMRDLRAGKMLRYAEVATHCYLAMGPAVTARRPMADVERWLHELGLPGTWGLLGYRDGLRTATALGPMRKAAKLGNKPNPDVWTRQIAVSTSYRLASTERELFRLREAAQMREGEE